ncbi:PhzF family phenazine biosynthesis protein [soil metagenome]
MTLRQWTVDAFASEPFMGNQAAVLAPLDAWPTDGWMQRLAQENNLSETAYLVRDPANPARFGIRWFTPAIEAPFCGHATLAAAHVLFTELGASADEIVFDTRFKGEFSVRRDGDAYRLDSPADPPRRIETPPGLEQALGVAPVETWAAQYLLVIVADAAAVRAITPDPSALAGFGVEASDGPGNVIVAALADPASGVDVVSRFFAPGSGIAEDAATGSAHTVLGPLFAQKLGRSDLRFHQAFPGRGANISVSMQGDRAILGGRAVTVMETILRLAPGCAEP